MITISRAPPYLTVQNGARRKTRSIGVPAGGAMDSFSLHAANIIVGNDPSAAALEWALGGGSFRFERDCVFAIAGATVRALVNGKVVAPCTTTSARAGEEVVVEQLSTGRFLYVAFHGGIDVPVVLGSRSTYLPAHFGGLDGRTVRTGDTLPLCEAVGRPPADGFHCAAELIPRYDSGIVHVVPGPQASLFDDSAWQVLTESSYRVSSASDRTGYKLEGPTLGRSPGSLPSEPGCPGSIQVPGDGVPITLMADAPTVGGYAKIAVVSEADLPLLAQRRPGETVRFEKVTIEQSQRALKRRFSDLNAIGQVAARSGS
jgi:antagonist of KipI